VITDARQQVLDRIRAAKGAAAGLAAAARAWQALPRAYQRQGTLTHDELLDLLTERLVDYDADVQRCASADVQAAVESALRSAGATRVAVPDGLNIALPSVVTAVAETTASTRDLDQCHAVLTRCTLGIAETGTLVLQAAPGQGRRAATLVPDVHVCVVRAVDVVASVPEAFDRLTVTSTLPTTFVSGPSATADIEMTRIKGVHGPRTLFVVIEL
jgi:L-lactate dehydrogenase complex protein LldG